MNLKKAALIAEVLGGIGIIVSILYLALEVAENSRNTDVSNQLALVQLNSDFRLHVASNAEASDLISRGSFEVESLTNTERDRFYLFAQHLFDLWEAAFILMDLEALDEDVGALWISGYCTYMDRPGYREIWSSVSNSNALPEFRKIVEECYSQ